jgi:hypothetical protein
MLCLAGTTVPTASAAALSASGKTTLVLCLQEEYLMRDTYQDILTKYPKLTSFSTVAADEIAMIAMLKKFFAKYRFAAPTDAKVSAARAIANTATSISNVHIVAINLEQSTANLMTRLLRTTRSTDLARAETLIRRMSLGSHTKAFAAEQATVAAHAQTTPRRTSPFPAPVTTRTVTVPASIDATGTTDVSTALRKFILSVPDGSLINFRSAAVYRIDHCVWFESRHNLILDGNGCTLKYTSVTGTTGGCSFWYPEGAGSDIWIRNFVLIGSSPYPGVYTPGTSPTGGEWQHGVIITGNRFEVSGCTISKVWGDGFLVDSGASYVWIHDNHVISAGRNGLSVISGTNVIAEHNAFDKTGLSAFNVEPNVATESCTNIIFRLNTIGTYGTPALFTPYAFSADATAGAVIDGIVINGNTVTGNSIATYVDSVGTVRMKHITFTNNKGGKAVAGAVIYFKHIDGLTITGNVQPLSSGVLAYNTDCTGAR